MSWAEYEKLVKCIWHIEVTAVDSWLYMPFFTSFLNQGPALKLLRWSSWIIDTAWMKVEPGERRGVLERGCVVCWKYRNTQSTHGCAVVFQSGGASLTNDFWPSTDTGRQMRQQPRFISSFHQVTHRTTVNYWQLIGATTGGVRHFNWWKWQAASSMFYTLLFANEEEMKESLVLQFSKPIYYCQPVCQKSESPLQQNGFSHSLFLRAQTIFLVNSTSSTSATSSWRSLATVRQWCNIFVD